MDTYGKGQPLENCSEELNRVAKLMFSKKQKIPTFHRDFLFCITFCNA